MLAFAHPFSGLDPILQRGLLDGTYLAFYRSPHLKAQLTKPNRPLLPDVSFLMYTVLTRSSALLAALVLLGATGPEASILKAEGYMTFIERLLQWGEYAGIFAVGWGTGVLFWMTTAHQAFRCIFFDLPQGWTLWQKGVLTSVIPASKYFVGGALFLGAGAFLARQLVGPWSQGFYVGVFAGGIVGAFWSLEKGCKRRLLVDFLLKNRRYVDTDRVPMFKLVE